MSEAWDGSSLKDVGLTVSWNGTTVILGTLDSTAKALRMPIFGG